MRTRAGFSTAGVERERVRISNPRRFVALALTLGTLGALVANSPGRASSPSAGTIDGTTAETRWSGSTVANSAGLSGGGCQLAVPDPTCDTYALTIGDLAPAPPAKKPKRSQPPPPAVDDVQVAISAPPATGVVEFDLYVYGPDGTEMARSTHLGSNDTVVLQNPKPGTYTVAVQNALSTDPQATYNAVARRFDGSSMPVVDEPTPCGLEGASEVRDLDRATVGAGVLVGDPTAATDGVDRGQRISLDVLVILDGVAQADAETLFAAAARSYAPLNIDLHPVAYQAHTFTTNDGMAIIREAKALFGGARPAGVDIVEVLTNQNIQQLGQSAVAGIADCIGGVAHPDRAFLVAEASTPSDVRIGPVPVVFDYQANPNVTAHEIGHLMGGQHHYANCVEGIEASDVHAEEGFVEASPCTLMFNAADFLGPRFDTINGTIVRGSAVRYAQP